MKKILAAVLCLMLVVSCIGVVSAESVYPIETDATLRVWINGHASSIYATANDAIWYNTLEEKTGIDVDWIEPAAGADATQAYNMMLAGGDWPDIICNADVVLNAQARLDEGVIITLDDYLETYSPNLWAMMQEYPDIDKTYKTDDGYYYCFPYLHGSETATGLWYNGAWLEECGLEVPATIDELTNVLKTFKDKYGVAPFSMAQNLMDVDGMGSYGVMTSLYDAYGITSRYGFYRDQDQKVHLSAYEPGYRDALRLLSGWYADGLLDHDYVSMGAADLAAKGAEGLIGVFVADYQVHDKLNAAYDGAENPWIPGVDPVLNEGDELAYFCCLTLTTKSGSAITTVCENPELACQFLDYCYGKEGNDFFNYGIEGESFTYNADGMPEYTDLYRNGPLGMGTYAGQYTPSVCGAFPAGFKDGDAGRARNSEALRNAELTWLNGYEGENWWLMPALTATADETEQYADLNSVIQTYCGEMHQKFITGEKSVEDDWDEFISTLEGMGVQDLIAIKQAQLDRFNAR